MQFILCEAAESRTTDELGNVAAQAEQLPSWLESVLLQLARDTVQQSIRSMESRGAHVHANIPIPSTVAQRYSYGVSSRSSVGARLLRVTTPVSTSWSLVGVLEQRSGGGND